MRKVRIKGQSILFDWSEGCRCCRSPNMFSIYSRVMGVSSGTIHDAAAHVPIKQYNSDMKQQPLFNKTLKKNRFFSMFCSNKVTCKTSKEGEREGGEL